MLRAKSALLGLSLLRACCTGVLVSLPLARLYPNLKESFFFIEDYRRRRCSSGNRTSFCLKSHKDFSGKLWRTNFIWKSSLPVSKHGKLGILIVWCVGWVFFFFWTNSKLNLFCYTFCYVQITTVNKWFWVWGHKWRRDSEACTLLCLASAYRKVHHSCKVQRETASQRCSETAEERTKDYSSTWPHCRCLRYTSRGQASRNTVGETRA